jgi:hypothetical protein
MRHGLVVLPLSVALLLTACAGSATSQSVNRPDSTPPNFVARVVTACRASGVYPGIGPNWQVELVVAILPAIEGNAGVVVARTTPVFMRRGAGSLSATPPDSFVSGDELEVWHDGSYAFGAVQSPPGRRTRQHGSSL